MKSPSKVETQCKIITTKISLKRHRIPLTFSSLSIESQTSFTVQSTKPQCSICLEPISFTSQHYLHCGHVFHCNCINMWLKDKAFCPYCKQSARGDCNSRPISMNTNNDEHFVEFELERMVVPDEIIDPNDSLIEDLIMIALIGLCFIISLVKIIVIRQSI